MRLLVGIIAIASGFFALDFLFGTDTFDNGPIGFLVYPIAVLFGAFVDYVGRKIIAIASLTSSEHASLYALAEREVEENSYDQGLWSKALIDCNGDESKRKITYMQLRAKQLMKEHVD